MFRFYKSWFPELSHFENDDDRRRAFGRVRLRATHTLAMLWQLPLFFGVFYVVIFQIAPLFAWWTGFNVGPVRAVFQMALIVLCGMATLWFARRRTQKELRTEPVNAGLPICISCGFDLHAQQDPRCPECGTPFDFADFDPSRLQRNTTPGEVPKTSPVKFQKPQRPKKWYSFLEAEIPHKACVAMVWTLIVFIVLLYALHFLLRR